MQAINEADGTPQPATPESGQSANWGSCGQPTPDTLPESMINVPSHRKKAPMCLCCQRDIAPTTSILSTVPSTEEIADAASTGHRSQYLIHSKNNEKIAGESDHCSHYSTDSEISEEASTAPHQEQDKISSLLTSLSNSVISLFNMAWQRNSRADAEVQDTIKLIKSLPTMRLTCIKNPTRKLTPSQYEQLLEKIEDGKVFPDKLRFEYTHSTQQFEIRMTTTVHEGIVGELNERFAVWKAELMKSNNSEISDAAKTLRLHGNKHVKLPALEEARDSKSPDGGIKHRCKLGCGHPALLFEIEFSHHTKKELRDRAQAYIEHSNGKIRTVIGVYMGEIYKAERENERRLKKMYRTRETDESGPQSYSTDDRNITGEASILKFRDSTGKAIQSTPLRISLEDCICESDIGSIVKEDLETYRRERGEVIRRQVQKEKEKMRSEEQSEAEGRESAMKG
ncbi:hypothetical protein GQX73_g10848 [Xylaria multiplex]|uniref:Uncharacterized protein n=1 Tax=Xylaria multiplex TaxID=323545 RepID=A0A7C8IG26_9PEZI|nr:hypothetical protein GQX73_g10848 [Xylaria multiplex]